MQSAGERRADPGVARVNGRVTAGEGESGGLAHGGQDEALVLAALAGDEAARARLVRAYLRRAMAVAVEYMGTREDAEDVVQDVFRSVFANLHRYDRGRPFGPWFFTILRNVARNAIASRRVRAHEALMADQAPVRATAFDEVQRAELRRAIDEAVRSLPGMQQTCFRLCMVEGLTSAEAAGATGLAETTVRVHVFRARRKLRELLDRWKEMVME